MTTLSPTYFPQSEGELIKNALGAAWQNLHPHIRRRFEHNPAAEQPLYYQGELDQLWCSRTGKWLGRLTAPFVGGALIPHCDRDVPVDIAVFGKPDSPAIFKRRWYRLHNRPPIIFTSKMLPSQDGALLEYVGAGLGMRLLLSVVDGDLHFHSDGYFWEIAGVRVPIFPFFTPGKTWLIHRNESAERFSIHIAITHPWLGLTFLQTGWFQETSVAPPDFH